MEERTQRRRAVDTATDHKCSRHRRYRMNCQQFAALKERAAGHCATCERVEPECVLHIDHDYQLGWYAVRGMVCPSCNQELHWIDNGSPYPSLAFRRYLEDPFWLTMYQNPEPFRMYRLKQEGELVWQWWPQAKARAEGESISARIIRLLEEDDAK